MQSKPIEQIFSEKLRYYMNLRDKTQIELAEYVGVDRSTVSYWCNQKKTPLMDKVDKICEFLHVSRTDLLSEATFVNTQEIRVTPELATILEKYNSLDELGKEAVKAVLNIEFARIKPHTEKFI